MLDRYKSVAPHLDSKGVRLENIPDLIDQNEQFVHYLQSKGAFDSNGKLIP